MRVAAVVTYFPSLSQTFVLRQLRGLLDRGHEVDVFAIAPEPAPSGSNGSTPSDGEHDALRAELALRGLGGHVRYDPPTPFRPLGRALGLIPLVARAYGGRVRTALRVAGRGAELGTRSLYHGASFIGQGAYDAILCHFGSSGQRALAARRAGLIAGPIATAFHGADMSRYLARHGARSYARLLAEGELFLPVSELWRKRLLALGALPARTVVHRMGIELARFPFLPREAPRPGAPLRLLAVGRLVEKKGMEYLVRAVPRLVARGVDASLRIVGVGPLRERLERVAGESSSGGRVAFLGGLGHDGVASEMLRADVLVAPSVTAGDGDMEGIPVVLMEAMASGVPVVSTVHSGIPELVTNGESGVLVRERDPDALAAAIGALVAEPARWAPMLSAARERVERLHDATRLDGELERLLAGMAGMGAPA